MPSWPTPPPRPRPHPKPQSNRQPFQTLPQRNPLPPPAGPPWSQGSGPPGAGSACCGLPSPTGGCGGRWPRRCGWSQGCTRPTKSPPPSSAASSGPGSTSPQGWMWPTGPTSSSTRRPTCAGGTTAPRSWPGWPCRSTGLTPCCGWPTACSAGTWRPPATRR